MSFDQFQDVSGCDVYFSNLLLCGLINNKILKLEKHTIVLGELGKPVLDEGIDSFEQRNFGELLLSVMINDGDSTVECPRCHSAYEKNNRSEDTFAKTVQGNHCHVCLRLI